MARFSIFHVSEAAGMKLVGRTNLDLSFVLTDEMFEIVYVCVLFLNRQEIYRKTYGHTLVNTVLVPSISDINISENKRTTMNGRARRILSLVPAVNANSDASDESSSGDEVRTAESSPAPSLESSFERLDILGSPVSSANHSDDEVDAEASYVEQETAQVPLTPVLQAVFPSPTQCNYYAIPSISSINSVASVQPSPTMATNIPLRTRGQRKRTGASVAVNRVKRRCVKKLNLRFRWKKVSFQHRADISNHTFEDIVPTDWSPLDYFYHMVTDIMENTNLYSVQETGKSIKVTEEEVLDFLAVNILMGIVVLPSYKDYWKSSFRYPKIAEVMSLKRFQQLRRYLHFTDNTQADVTDSVVYFDNYFTSLELLYILRENYGIFSLGTVRKNRLKDAECKMIDDKTLQKKGRGAFTQVVCNENKLSVRKQDRLKDFRYEIYAGLLKRDRTVPVKDIDSVPERQKIKKPNAERPFDDVRYDKYDHWPQLTGYQRCKYCKGGQASTMCTKCKVHLCYVKGRNCFLAYHTKH
ncbi:hypothetical protein HW555_005299 [Spodoptera exigua]|uniref:PiggyBac transposable element-derived protein domain-containing protein n=1 Tax=Spodoptera exigua TaxID=7107 RepID=A0A835GJA4_SPOEX|nr:hypothetical protein HW555_005299 [Spodoptera exigua]